MFINLLNNFSLYPKGLLAILVLLSTSCSSDDCMKTITISEPYYFNGQQLGQTVTQEVPCDTKEPEGFELEEIEYNKLENFSYEVVVFDFIPDTGEGTSRLYFEIKLINPNDYSVIGYPFITLKINGDNTSSINLTDLASEPCTKLESESSCIFSFKGDDPIDFGIKAVALIDVIYVVTTDN